MKTADLIAVCFFVSGACLLTTPGACWADTIPISSIEDLQKIGNDPAYPLNGSYVLTQDIDASATATWNAGAGFIPIGGGSNPFVGTLDGQGHVISGLTINAPIAELVGLFGEVGSGGMVKNLGIDGGTVMGAGPLVLLGGLVGSNDNGATIMQC